MDDIYTVSLLKPNETSVKRHPAGRFMIKNGQLNILEDYHGILGRVLPPGEVTQGTVARIQALKHNPYLHIVSRSEQKEGHDLDHVQEADTDGDVPVPPTLPAPEHRPAPVFDYHRAGMENPHILEVKGNEAVLDGKALEPDEVQRVMENVKTGVATLRYRQHPASEVVKKMEGTFDDLIKEEGLGAREAFEHLAGAVRAGHVDPKVEAAFRKLVYEDAMTPGLGNKFAFQEFMKTPRQGVFVSIDGNEFRAVNSAFGHEGGDAAIKAYGKAAREAMDEAVGSKHGKLFHTPDTQHLYRSGGDEAVAFFPSHEHAALFARAFRNKLDALPPMGGVHKLSASMGFGHDYATADKALYEAKKQKFGPMGERIHKPTEVPTFAHSLVPGHEGPIKLDDPSAPPKIPPQNETVSAPEPSGTIHPTK